MSRPIIRGPLLCLALLAAVSITAAETQVTVDFDHPTRTDVNAGGAGVNVCWLLDSDWRRKQPASMADALTQLHVGALRFPYGHLADNYLWHAPGAGAPEAGLQPRVASRQRPPGKWTWAVRPDGTMPHAMDFDEYVALCERLGARPLVCVNALAFKYAGGPTYEQLKASAVAWVAYARTKPYRVAYWQIGNEVDHGENRQLLPMDEYVALYADFAAAMKRADPAARIGPGILSRPEYYRAVAAKCPHLVDFASVHQYMHGAKKSCAEYAGWRDCTDRFIGNVERAARTLSEAGLAPRVPLLVTETGVSGAPGDANNTFKALWWFEVLMNELSHPAVAYTFYWGTHSPWEYSGEDREPARDVAVALRLRTNARTPTGEIMRFVNQGLRDEFVTVPRVHGRLRLYALRARNGRRRALFVLNKDDQPAEVVLALAGAAGAKVTRAEEFAGQSPDDRAPVVRPRALPVVQGQRLLLSVAPLSITRVEFGD